MDRSSFLTQLHGRYALPRSMVVELAERSTGIEAVQVQRLISGDENEVYRVELWDGSAVYPRITWPGKDAVLKGRRETWAMEQARSVGVPVPEVLADHPIGSDDGERFAIVVAGSPGRQLSSLLPSLTTSERREAMVDLGRCLAKLHCVSMPGAGVPEDDGSWPDPHTHRHGYLAARLDGCSRLSVAGLSRSEIAAVTRHPTDNVNLLVPDKPVLCHGDLGPEHVFLDGDLHVCGLIDWGMWNAGSAAGDLASVAIRHDDADFVAVAVGHGGPFVDVAESRQAVLPCLIAQLIGHAEWYLTSGQAALLPPSIAALRRALAAVPGA